MFGKEDNRCTRDVGRVTWPGRGVESLAPKEVHEEGKGDRPGVVQDWEALQDRRLPGGGEERTPPSPPLPLHILSPTLF